MSLNNLNNASSAHRDYGATSNSNTNMLGGGGSSSNNVAAIPDVNFSGFSPTEFMSLSEEIAQNIQDINSSSKQLDKIMQIIGTLREQKSTRDKVQDINTKVNQCIETTSVDLQRLTPIVRRGDKQQELQLVKLTNDFRTVVERYTTLQKRIATTMRQTFSQMQILQSQQEQSGDDAVLLRDQQQWEQQKLQFEHDMLVERERQIQFVESQVLDVNVIMRKINDVVHAHSEHVERIESHVENAATEVELGREQLQTAAGRRQSYRRKILLLLVIAVIIGLIVTGIIVSKVTS